MRELSLRKKKSKDEYKQSDDKFRCNGIKANMYFFPKAGTAYF